MKICSKCKEEKSLDCFSKNKWRKDGLSHYCKQCKKNAKKVDYEKHRDAYRENQKLYYEKNKNQIKEKVNSWRQENLARYNARMSKRRSDKIKATPKWADLKKINQIYIECKILQDILGVKMQVDHIIPLNGKNVCGLHCEDNLRIIHASENQTKGNKLLEELLQ